jgi:hypothetical protein
MARASEKVGGSGLKSWEIEQYIYQEPIDEKRPSHGDPRLEPAQQSHGQHQDLPYDDCYEYGSHAFDSYFTPHLDASAFNALLQRDGRTAPGSEIGLTSNGLLAGSGEGSSHKELRDWLANQKFEQVRLAKKYRRMGLITEKEYKDRKKTSHNDYFSSIEALDNAEKGKRKLHEEWYGKKE